MQEGNRSLATSTDIVLNPDIAISKIEQQSSNCSIKPCTSISKEIDIEVTTNDPCTELGLGYKPANHHQLTVRPSKRQVHNRFMKQQAISIKEFKRCKEGAGAVSSGRKQQQSPNCTKQEEEEGKRKGSGEMKYCSECGKGFQSWKALFGHMRCHPEREWRGINPPSAVMTAHAHHKISSAHRTTTTTSAELHHGRHQQQPTIHCARNSWIWKSEVSHHTAPAPFIRHAQDLHHKDEEKKRPISTATNSQLETAEAHHNTEKDERSYKDKCLQHSGVEAAADQSNHAKDGCHGAAERDGSRYREDKRYKYNYNHLPNRSWSSGEDHVVLEEEEAESETDTDGSGTSDDNYHSKDNGQSLSTTVVIRGKRSRRSKLKPLLNVVAGGPLSADLYIPSAEDNNNNVNPPSLPAALDHILDKQGSSSLLKVDEPLKSRTNVGSSQMAGELKSQTANLGSSSLLQVARSKPQISYLEEEEEEEEEEEKESKEDQLEMARCLVMLARSSPTDASQLLGFYHRQKKQMQDRIVTNAGDSHLTTVNSALLCNYSIHEGSAAAADSRDATEFECGTCRRKFKSRQALGGHRASHKKIKGCFAKTWGRESNMSPPNVTTMFTFSNSNNKRQQQQHRCTICLKVFPSGQALGGHKRCHWTIVDEHKAVGKGPLAYESHPATSSKGCAETRSSSSYQLQLLDLNHPSPFSSNPPSQSAPVTHSIGCLLSLGTPLHHAAGLTISPDRKEEQTMLSLTTPCVPA